jgi:hypothetical protein
MNNIQPDLTNYDQPSRALNILSFICPPLGLIIYLALVGKLPRQAISAGHSATKGVGAYVCGAILVGIIALGVVALEAIRPAPNDDTTTVGTAPAPPQPKIENTLTSIH